MRGWMWLYQRGHLITARGHFRVRSVIPVWSGGEHIRREFSYLIRETALKRLLCTWGDKLLHIPTLCVSAYFWETLIFCRNRHQFVFFNTLTWLLCMHVCVWSLYFWGLGARAADLNVTEKKRQRLIYVTVTERGWVEQQKGDRETDTQTDR